MTSRPDEAHLVDRLRATLRTEADAVEPFGPRARALAALTEHDTRRRASRRRRAAAVTTAAAAVAAVAAVVTVTARTPAPTPVGVSGLGAGAGFPLVGAPPATRARIPQRAGPPAAAAHAPVSAATSPPQTPATQGTAAASAVPAGFSAMSVTFVTPYIGWVLGTVPCGTGSSCAAIARTSDGGVTWQYLGSPSAGAQTLAVASGSQLQLQLRFADTSSGWIFGTAGGQPVLWATHDGGATWGPQQLPGASGVVVSSLEAAGGQVRLSAVTAQPLAVSIYGSPRATNSWKEALSLPTASSPAAPPQVVLQQSAGWLVEDDGGKAVGARLARGRWTQWTPPCGAGGGIPLLAAPTPVWLAAVCPASSTLEASSDGGSTWVGVGALPPVTVDAVAASSPGAVVLAGHGPTQAVIDRVAATGAPWQTAWTGPAGARVTELGFETTAQGVAVVDTGSGGELLMTHDGGASWQQVSFAG